MLQAVVELADEFDGQAAQGGFVAVAGSAALAVAGAGAGETDSTAKAHQRAAS